MDGSQKLGPRLLGTVRDAQAAGTSTVWLEVAVASWIAFVLREVGSGRALDDPLAERLTAAAFGPSPVTSVLDIEQIFGTDLSAGSEFGTRVAATVRVLSAKSIENIEKELS